MPRRVRLNIITTYEIEIDDDYFDPDWIAKHGHFDVADMVFDQASEGELGDPVDGEIGGILVPDPRMTDWWRLIEGVYHTGKRSAGMTGPDEFVVHGRSERFSSLDEAVRACAEVVEPTDA